ncbi:uncharacterized protein LOC126324030 isoform X2 [Schistocerca gregaria]|uniref:uncharacterized protein LOC126324030 isoform X2 n=1 Tax=Schistocerca gregaria TaxID=7010 RepID=UPI00211EBF27|nr:uncharacterized protein LOC126324030 isoform X2 [Schistocerca gregaria]
MAQSVQVEGNTSEGTLIKWKCPPQRWVRRGQVLAECVPSSQKICAPIDGKITDILVQDGEPIFEGKVVARIQPCDHHFGFLGPLCVICGQDLSHELHGRTLSEVIHPLDSDFRLEKDVAQRHFEKHKDELLSQNRLILMLDLDQTLLHATTLGTSNIEYKDIQELVKRGIHVITLSGTKENLLVKFRPGLKQFLLHIHKLYEIYICTLGNLRYAQCVVDLILKYVLDDVHSSIKDCIFSNRIITRNHMEDSITCNHQGQDNSENADCARRPPMLIKDLRRLVSDDSIVVILDDSEEVWPGYSDHLVNLEKFVFFSTKLDLNKTFHAVVGNVKKRVMEFTDNYYPENPKRMSKADDQILEKPASEDAESNMPLVTSVDITSSNEVLDVNVNKPSSQGAPPESLQNKGASARPVDRLFEDGPCEVLHDRPSPRQSDLQVLHPFDLKYLPSSDLDQVLWYMTRTLETVNRCFFSIKSAKRKTIKYLLPKVRRGVLSGASVYLNMLPPPSIGSMRKLAKSFGAQRAKKISEATHIVLRQDYHPSQIKEVPAHLRHTLVDVLWLVDSVKRWCWQDEVPYRLEPSGSADSEMATKRDIVIEPETESSLDSSTDEIIAKLEHELSEEG